MDKKKNCPQDLALDTDKFNEAFTKVLRGEPLGDPRGGYKHRGGYRKQGPQEGPGPFEGEQVWYNEKK